MKLITVIIPCYNEERNLRPVYEQLRSMSTSAVEIEGIRADMNDYDWQFLFVNDGSGDMTEQVLSELHSQDHRVSYISLSRNFGKESAMLAGLDNAKGDAVVIMDADLQHPVGAIPEMVVRWSQGHDDVYGRRLTRGKESWLRRRLSGAFYSLLDKVGDSPTLPNVGDFRLMDRRMVDALTSMRETQRYTKGLYCWVGFDKYPVDYATAERNQGKSTFGFWRLLNLAIDGITSYTTAPLRVATIAGACVSVISFVYMLYIVGKTLIFGEPIAGFPTLICTILLLGGLQLLALGIIGEYIGRIYKESKRRPPYIIKDAK